MSLREQFEAFVINEGYRVYRARKHPSVPVSVADAYADSAVELAWQTFQLGHAVNADLLEALESVVNESVVVYDNGKYSTVQISSGVLEEVTAAIKKARAE